MWYGIRTKPGQEEVVRRLIGGSVSQEGLEDCRMLYCIRKKRYLGAWHEERERFLPGYLFMVADKLPECIDGIFPVGDEEEKFLMKLTGGKDEIGMSYGVIRDGILEIRSGGLVGMEARIRKIDRHKRKGAVALKLHGVETVVELGLEITEKTHSAETISRRKGACLRGDVP